MKSACDSCGLVKNVDWYDEEQTEGTDLEPGGYCPECAFHHDLI